MDNNKIDLNLPDAQGRAAVDAVQQLNAGALVQQGCLQKSWHRTGPENMG